MCAYDTQNCDGEEIQLGIRGSWTLEHKLPRLSLVCLSVHVDYALRPAPTTKLLARASFNFLSITSCRTTEPHHVRSRSQQSQ